MQPNRHAPASSPTSTCSRCSTYPSDPTFPLATFPGPSRRIRVEPLIAPEPAPGPSEPPDEPELPPEEPRPAPVPVPVP
jgi:hypothetical protein